jgi:hypothetical protein
LISPAAVPSGLVIGRFLRVVIQPIPLRRSARWLVPYALLGGPCLELVGGG